MARLRNALNAVADSPFVGHGIGYNSNSDIEAHNMFLAMWIDFGVFGLIIYTALLAVGFWKFYRAKYWPGIFFIGLVGLISMTIQHILTLYTVFIIMGLLLSLRQEDQTYADESSQRSLA